MANHIFGWLLPLILLSQFGSTEQRFRYHWLPENASQKTNNLKGVCAVKKRKGSEISSVHLQTLDGKIFTLSALRKKLLAVIFLAPECPLSQNYTLTINELQTKFEKYLDIVGIFPGKSNQLTSCQAFRKKYNVRFIMLRDTSQRLVEVLGAKITPEVFLLDGSKNIIYHGAIDNWAVALGKQRTKATENYLEDDIVEFLNGASIKIKEIPPIGCFINKF